MPDLKNYIYSVIFIENPYILSVLLVIENIVIYPSFI